MGWALHAASSVDNPKGEGGREGKGIEGVGKKREPDRLIGAWRAASSINESRGRGEKEGEAEREALKTVRGGEEEGFGSLFNGKDLTGWDGRPGLWAVNEGAIRGETTATNRAPGNTFLIWRGGILKDFDLRLSYRILKHFPRTHLRR